MVEFDGTQDTNFYHISQTVKVEPSTDYILSYWAMSEGLTSKSGITIEVIDADSGPQAFCLWAPQIKGSTPWKKIVLPLKTNSSTKRLTIRVRRFGEEEPLKVSHLFGIIQGAAFIDAVSLVKGKDVISGKLVNQ